MRFLVSLAKAVVKNSLNLLLDGLPFRSQDLRQFSQALLNGVRGGVQFLQLDQCGNFRNHRC